MKTYTILSPTLTGVLSDDYLYFEGTRRPQEFFTLRDGGVIDKKSIATLAQYWNDIYTLFLRKLTQFTSSGPASDEEALKLQALLQELIKVKGLIDNAPKVDIMRE